MDINLLDAMHAGCEDLDSGVLSENSIYAAALMGGEGFMDTIKKGAKASLAWIKQLLNNILDAILFWFGGRENVKNKLDKLKRSKMFSIFRSDLSKKVEKVTLPAVAVAYSHVNSIIDDEYQEFFRDKLKETSEITAFFVGVSSMSDVMEKYIREAKNKPLPEHLDLTDILAAARKSADAGRKLVQAIEKEKEPNQEVIKNLQACVSKLAKGINVLTSAMKVVAKSLDELDKEVEGKSVYDSVMLKAIESGDISNIRAALITEIDTSSNTPEHLNAIITQLEKDFPDLYDEYKENTMAGKPAPKEDWSEDTYYKQNLYTNANFSKKRVHLLRDIRNYLRSQKVKGF